MFKSVPPTAPCPRVQKARRARSCPILDLRSLSEPERHLGATPLNIETHRKAAQQRSTHAVRNHDTSGTTAPNIDRSRVPHSDVERHLGTPESTLTLQEKVVIVKPKPSKGITILNLAPSRDTPKGMQG